MRIQGHSSRGKPRHTSVGAGTVLFLLRIFGMPLAKGKACSVIGEEETGSGTRAHGTGLTVGLVSTGGQ